MRFSEACGLHACNAQTHHHNTRICSLFQCTHARMCSLIQRTHTSPQHTNTPAASCSMRLAAVATKEISPKKSPAVKLFTTNPSTSATANPWSRKYWFRVYSLGWGFGESMVKKVEITTTHKAHEIRLIQKHKCTASTMKMPHIMPEHSQRERQQASKREQEREQGRRCL